MNYYDAIIIGGGRAAPSAGLVLSRAGQDSAHRRGRAPSRPGRPAVRIFVPGRVRGVIGGAPAGVRHAQTIRQLSVDVRHFTPPDILTATGRTGLVARAVGVVEGSIDQLVIDEADQLRGLQMNDGRVIPPAAVFVPPRFAPNDTLRVGLGCVTDPRGWVTVDPHCERHNHRHDHRCLPSWRALHPSPHSPAQKRSSPRELVRCDHSSPDLKMRLATSRRMRMTCFGTPTTRQMHPTLGVNEIVTKGQFVRCLVAGNSTPASKPPRLRGSHPQATPAHPEGDPR